MEVFDSFAGHDVFRAVIACDSVKYKLEIVEYGEDHNLTWKTIRQ